MSPTQASAADDRDFPRLNGRNFIIWKTRVTAALEGKNLLGFVTQVDYAGDDSDLDFDADEDLNSALSGMADMTDMSDALDAAGAPKADELGDPSSSESSSDSSSAKSDAATTGDDCDVEMGQESPPIIQSFSGKWRDELKRAERLKAKSQKPSSRKLRLNEAKAKAFLIKTIDDQHILLVKDKTTAFEIFQTNCSKYEGADIHGDPYHVLSYLMALKYEVGSDLTTFIIEIESAMRVAAEATNSVLSDEQKSLYLYHALPSEWKPQLSAWKGSRKFIPYEELKRHIEATVQNELARNCYTLKQGTPESKETRSERALQATTSMPSPPSEANRPCGESALVSNTMCTYCHRDNHATVDCYILQRYLHQGQVKPGTVLPANFKLKPPQTQQRQHPYKGSYNDRPRHQPRNNFRGNRNDNRNNNSERHQGRNKFHGRRNNNNNTNSDSGNGEYGIIAITTLDLSCNDEEVGLTAKEAVVDPMWTVDSGCTRHVTANSQWFEKLTPTVGKSITVGGNHQIPIKGTGGVKMKIKNTKGKEQVITLNNVLYAPGLEFNLLSVRQAVEDDFKINFPNANKCVLFFAHRTKFEAKTGEGTRLYQFQASPATSNQEAHVATSGSD